MTSMGPTSIRRDGEPDQHLQPVRHVPGGTAPLSPRKLPPAGRRTQLRRL